MAPAFCTSSRHVVKGRDWVDQLCSHRRGISCVHTTVLTLASRGRVIYHCLLSNLRVGSIYLIR